MHVVPALFGEEGIIGGAERYALELARHMADEVPTRLVTFGDKERRETLGNLQLHVIGRARYVRGQPTNPIAAAFLWELRAAGIVHCHQQHVLASSLAALYCRMTRRRIFVTDLGGGGWDLSAYVKTDGLYDGHLHISEYSRRVYHHQALRSARVILGGVDGEKFSPAPTRRQRKVAFVGRLLPHKGIDVLIKAMPPDAELDLIGRIFDQRYLTDLHRLADAKRVNFYHDFDDAALMEAYRSVACVALPSVYKTIYGETSAVPELLGQTLLEAMACGAPTICTSVASLPEIVLDELTGFVVPPGDSAALGDRIRWLLDHPREGAAMGAAGRRRVLEHFTWPAVVRRCLEAYRGAQS